MRRIIIGLITIVGAGAMVISGATGAFFSDTETSTGNTFTAGAIDLKIDNDSWYNGNRCTNVGTQENPVWQWQGTAGFPVSGTSCTTSFKPSNLDGLLFFNFRDLKPDDEGEDTISIDVQNDAWTCMDLTLTSDDDKSSTEPELDAPDVLENSGDAWDGELADAINFFWWADDGDNVYEVGENQITNGVISLANLDDTFPIAIADSENNVWGDVGNPVPGGETVYIAKAWCMGTLTLDAVPVGDNPSVDPGVNCDGTALGNVTQTDMAELNIIFSAVQARHNPNFECNPDVQPLPTLTVNKILTVDHGTISIEDFALHIDGPIPGPGDDQIVGDNVPTPNLPVGTYTVSEVIDLLGIPPGTTFTTTFGGACDPVTHIVNLALGDNLVCTIN